MPRSKKGRQRKTMVTMGEMSGGTVSTTPSGVTLIEAGIAYNGTTAITPTELGYLDGAANNLVGCPTTTGYMVTGASVTWAGASISIATGLTNILALVGGAGETSAVSNASLEWMHNTALAAGTVTAALVSGSSGARYILPAGGNLQWVAIGT